MKLNGLVTVSWTRFWGTITSFEPVHLPRTSNHIDGSAISCRFRSYLPDVHNKRGANIDLDEMHLPSLACCLRKFSKGCTVAIPQVQYRLLVWTSPRSTEGTLLIVRQIRWITSLGISTSIAPPSEMFFSGTLSRSSATFCLMAKSWRGDDNEKVWRLCWSLWIIRYVLDLQYSAISREVQHSVRCDKREFWGYSAGQRSGTQWLQKCIPHNVRWRATEEVELTVLSRITFRKILPLLNEMARR